MDLSEIKIQADESKATTRESADEVSSLTKLVKLPVEAGGGNHTT